jgi:hypothetical protein
MDAYIREEITPFNLRANEFALKTCIEILEQVKADPDLFVFKKSLVTEKMLRTSLAARKPKKECLRLYELYQECMTDTLQGLSDIKEVEEVVVLIWARVMKQSHKSFPSLIESLTI